MKLVHGVEIQRALRMISPSQIAVAYVGADWKTYVEPEKLQDIILSPTIGSNPAAIAEIVERIGWERVHFLDNLHSKIYLGESGAAVGSFNLTANGLSAEGLQEVGFVVEDKRVLDELRTLFHDYRHQAHETYPTIETKVARLAELRAIWDRAIKQGVIRSDARAVALDAYRPIAVDEVYVCWVLGEINYTDEVVSLGTVKYSLSFLESDVVRPDRWILCWTPRGNGYPDRRCRPYWLHIDEVVEGGATEAPYTKVAIERTGRAHLPPPFEITDEAAHALYAVLESDEFPEFLDAQDPWSLNSTLPSLPAFLRALGTASHRAVGVSNSTPVPESVISSTDALVSEFSARIREAMYISLSKRYVKSSIEGLLETYPPVTLAKRLVKPGSDIKSGLKSLAKHGALRLSFESIMLEPRFAPLFSKNDLDCARFNLFEADPSYLPPSK